MTPSGTLRHVLAVSAFVPALCCAQEWRVVAEAFPAAVFPAPVQGSGRAQACGAGGYRVVAAVTSQGRPVARLGRDEFAVEAYACHAQHCAWKTLQVASVDDRDFVDGPREDDRGAYTIIAVPHGDGVDVAAPDSDHIVMLQLKVYRPLTAHGLARHVVAATPHRQAAATLVRYTDGRSKATDDVFEGFDTAH